MTALAPSRTLRDQRARSQRAQLNKQNQQVEKGKKSQPARAEDARGEKSRRGPSSSWMAPSAPRAHPGWATAASPGPQELEKRGGEFEPRSETTETEDSERRPGKKAIELRGLPRQCGWRRTRDPFPEALQPLPRPSARAGRGAGNARFSSPSLSPSVSLSPSLSLSSYRYTFIAPCPAPAPRPRLRLRRRSGPEGGLEPRDLGLRFGPTCRAATIYGTLVAALVSALPVLRTLSL